jgi:hypothetical protein
METPSLEVLGTGGEDDIILLCAWLDGRGRSAVLGVTEKRDVIIHCTCLPYKNERNQQWLHNHNQHNKPIHLCAYDVTVLCDIVSECYINLKQQIF